MQTLNYLNYVMEQLLMKRILGRKQKSRICWNIKVILLGGRLIKIKLSSWTLMMMAGNNRLEEWALISKAKAIENERMLENDRIQQYNKKMKFKRDLDAQLSQKGNSQLEEQKRDLDYFNHIINKGNEQRQKEQRQKMERMDKRRQMEEENKHIVEETVRQSRSQSNDNGYKLDIGIKSELMQKQREEMGKRQMKMTIEEQIKQKRVEGEKKKFDELIQDIKHNRAQAQTFEHHRPSKSYKQDQRVYENYERLLQEKKRQQEELEKKIVDEAAYRKMQAEENRKRMERMKKEELTIDMKETLDQQVKIYNYKKNYDKQVNPEENSFRFISDIYRDHPPAYNKQQYQEELRRQAEEQKNRKKELNYMSDEEYKFNMNQLNKIMTGNYAHDHYIDRSLGAIGERRVDHRKLLEREDDNSDFMKRRLDDLRNRRGGGIYSKMENSSLI